MLISEAKQKFAVSVFNILICEVASDDIFNLSKAKPIHRVVSDKNIFAINPVVIIADPFLFVKDDTLFLFYEEQRGFTGKGVLRMISTKNLVTWTPPITILEEPLHLSYPNVFLDNGKVYMIPETGHNSDIRLYQLDDDCKQATYVKTLLEGENFVDTSIFKYNDRVYLFTTIYKGGRDYELKLYESTQINGEWTIHPCSPLSTSNKLARNGGPIIKLGDKYYRMAQDCSNNYGGGLNCYQINTINSTEYVERKYKSLLPCDKLNLHLGGHHYSVVEFLGRQIVSVDYLSNSYYLKEICSRIKSKLITEFSCNLRSNHEKDSQKC